MIEVMQQFAAGQLSVVTVGLWTLVALVLAMSSGALAGIGLAGKAIGNELAASMGAMLGPIGAVPGVFLGLVVLSLS